MPSLGPILEHVGPFLLVMFRISGLFVFAPMLGGAIVPMRVRLLLCLGFAVALYPALPSSQVAAIEFDVFSLGPAVLAEVLIGTAIGLLAAMPIYAVQLGGLIMGQQAGMALGQVYNPALETESDVLGQFLLYAALVIFVLMGGLEALFIATGATFAGVPAGRAALDMAPMELLTGLVASGFELALRISAPVLCIILIETVASSLLAKTIPQINVQSIGFAVKVLITLLVLAASSGAIMHAAGTDISDALGLILRWAEGIGHG